MISLALFLIRKDFGMLIVLFFLRQQNASSDSASLTLDWDFSCLPLSHGRLRKSVSRAVRVQSFKQPRRVSSLSIDTKEAAEARSR